MVENKTTGDLPEVANNIIATLREAESNGKLAEVIKYYCEDLN